MAKGEYLNLIACNMGRVDTRSKGLKGTALPTKDNTLQMLEFNFFASLLPGFAKAFTSLSLNSLLLASLPSLSKTLGLPDATLAVFRMHACRCFWLNIVAIHIGSSKRPS
jgi:hypothetical protein